MTKQEIIEMIHRAGFDPSNATPSTTAWRKLVHRASIAKQERFSMKSKIHIVAAAVLLIGAVSVMGQSREELKLSPQTKEILEKWVDISSNSIDQFSIRAATDSKDSLFKDRNGNYKWFMRIDYKKPKNKVAFSISNGYFNCDESEVSFDQTVNYSSAGLVIETLGEKGGRKKAIPVTPDSVAEKSLKFVCSVKFD